MQNDKIVTTVNRENEDILSAVWHWLCFLAIKRFTGTISITFVDGKIKMLKKDLENIEATTKALHKETRLGHCKPIKISEIKHE